MTKIRRYKFRFSKIHTLPDQDPFFLMEESAETLPNLLVSFAPTCVDVSKEDNKVEPDSIPLDQACCCDDPITSVDNIDWKEK
jgi:hypothetical protein